MLGVRMNVLLIAICLYLDCSWLRFSRLGQTILPSRTLALTEEPRVYLRGLEQWISRKLIHENLAT